jgi:hypothetical protein
MPPQISLPALIRVMVCVKGRIVADVNIKIRMLAICEVGFGVFPKILMP